ncbi:SIMPL domain-containing protein [Patescibacteria group bacterium]|nr:SIMPL domain-containing protein [Patescibacteria group bacterium]
MSESLKTALATIILLFLGLFIYGKFGPGLPLSVSSITTAQPAPFTVSADGKVLAKPDVAQVNLGFTTSGSSVSQVQSQANQTINNISAAVKKLGIGESDIQTTNYNLRPDYDYNSKPQRITGYTIDVNIEVKVRDFGKINQVIDAGTTNGANTVGGLQFTVDNPETYRAQARKLAIDNAEKKAAEIAGESGITLGRLINVSEGNTATPQPLYMDKAVGLGGGTAPSVPTQIEPGTSEISVTVTLSYETR